MLYGVGEVLPIANKTFLAIQALIFQQGVKPPKAFKLLRNALVARTGNIIVNNARVLNLIGDIDTESAPDPVREVFFSSRIKSVI